MAFSQISDAKTVGQDSSADEHVAYSLEKDAWWRAVQAVSDILVSENLDSWDENLLIGRLTAASFSKDTIDQALTWLQNAALNGQLQQIIGFIYERDLPRMRIENPSEGAFISNRLWKRLETMRLKGIINLETVERLLAGLRSLDCRDWEEDEVWEYISQVAHRDRSGTSLTAGEVSDPIVYRDRPYC